MPEPQTGSVFNLDDAWTTSEGKSFHLRDLAGKPTVVAMFYTSCKDVCPLIVVNMKKIERALPPDLLGKVQFAAFSFDTERDTTEKLKEYAVVRHIDSPSWLLARSDSGAVRRLSVALGIKYKKLRAGDFEHDTLITILDRNGVITHQQLHLDQGIDETISAIKKMVIY
jgi:protein SCO1/2